MVFKKRTQVIHWLPLISVLVFCLGSMSVYGESQSLDGSSEKSSIQMSDSREISAVEAVGVKKALKGHIVFTPQFGSYTTVENGFVVYQNGIVLGVYKTLPEDHKDAEVKDLGDKLIIPGFVDAHLHAPQFANRGLGLDKELLPWLETYTFPEEAKYTDPIYAKEAYERFVKELWKQGTTRSVIFSTVHRESTEMLMEMMDQAGLGGYVGKVNMDRNAPGYLVETTENSVLETKLFLEETQNRWKNVKPIITPRFVPTCTSELMMKLGALAKEYNVPVQSHIAENEGEIAWVKELYPDSENYAGVYEQFGLFGQQPTMMAHAVHITDEEIGLMAKNKVFVAHSPHSNNNLFSGMAPVRRMIEAGVPMALASDVSGGHEISMPKVIVAAAQVSKLKWLDENKEYRSLSTSELFYLATKGGGSFFGNVGSFEEGYQMDALIIDDAALRDSNQRSLEERLQRYLYCGDDRQIVERYVSGEALEEPIF